MTIVSAHRWRDNAQMIAEAVVPLGYIQPDDRVIDLTFGRGNWWTQYVHHGEFFGCVETIEAKLALVASGCAVELRVAPDFRDLSILAANDRFDVVVFDPPYVCVSLDTEIFTKRGWLKYSEVTTDDEAYVLGHVSGFGQWQRITDVHVLPAETRRMLEMSGSSHSSRSTAEHRWPVITRRRNGRPAGRTFRTSTTLKSDDVVPVAARSRGAAEASMPDELVELVAWFWTEGHIEGRRAGHAGVGTYGNITQSHEVNADNCARIEHCLEKVFGPASESFPRLGRKTDGVARWRKASDDRNNTYWLSSDAGWLLLYHAPNLVPSPEFLCALTPEQLDLFIETSLDADGHRSASGASLGQKERSMAEAFGMACIMAGRPITYTTDPSRGHVVHIRSREVFKPSRNHPRWVDTNERVWCVTVPASTWLARRNGTVYFTGNSMGGRASSGMPEFMERYGLENAESTPEKLHADNAKGLAEAARIVKPGGLILAKCAPYISSGVRKEGDWWARDAALKLGLKVHDMFIHLGDVRAQPKVSTCRKCSGDGFVAVGFEEPKIVGQEIVAAMITETCPRCKGKPPTERKQVHARNNYSVMFVFKRPPTRKSNKRKKEPDGNG